MIRSLCLIGLFIISIFSCRKKEAPSLPNNEPPIIHYLPKTFFIGNADAIVNGQVWHSDSTFGDFHDSTIQVFAYEYADSAHKAILDDIDFMGVRKNMLYQSIYKETWLNDSTNRTIANYFGLLPSYENDQGCANFDALETADSNYIRITSIAPDSTYVEGVFKVTFLKVSQCPYMTWPDTVKITNGRFHLERRKD